MSAPKFEHVGRIDAVAEDLCMALPSPSTVQPWVTHLFKRSALPSSRQRSAARLEPAAVLVEAPDRRSRARSPDPSAHGGEMRRAESNQPSSVSVSFVERFLPPQWADEALGDSPSASRSNQMFEPCSLNRAGDVGDGPGVQTGLPQSLGKTPGWAEPQRRDGRCTSRRARGSWRACGRAPPGCQMTLSRRRRRRPERIDRAEPLRRGAEDDGLVAAPAVRVAVDDILARKEHAALAHILENDRVGFLGLHAGVFAGVVGGPWSSTGTIMSMP